MRFGLVALAYNEERFVRPFLKHIPKWVDETLVLVSSVPWQGRHEIPDDTDLIADKMGATVIVNSWKTEEEQRNAGQDWHHDKDWVIVLDPDEFLTKQDWTKLKEFLESEPHHSAFVTGSQFTYWKSGYRIDPQEEYKQIIAVRPHIRFIDKRVVGSGWDYAPTVLHHMSWARTDKECLSKISHYAHAHELNDGWYENVWLADKMENVHPLTPESLKRVIPAKLPQELEDLGIWPPAKKR